MKFNYFNLKNEDGLLRLSAFGNIFLSLLGIFFGLLSSSAMIIFDSVYGMIDTLMTILSLVVVRLIKASTSKDFAYSKLERHFTMGFWHLEPILLGLNGTLLIGTSVYAFINAVESFLLGGRVIHFGYAIVITLISLIVGLYLGLFIKKMNKSIDSEFLNLDAISWLISAYMSLGLLVAFSFGYIIEDTHLQYMAPYIDPLILMIVCIFIIPMPFKTVKQALEDILLVTPPELEQQVRVVAKNIVEKYGFNSFRTYVAKVGRGRQIELYFIVPKDYKSQKLEEWDRLRDEIEKEFGEEDPDLWLTIVFTTDLEWAE